MKHSIKFVLSIITMTLATLVFSGCNTVEGLGEDVEEAGEEMSDAAR